MKITPRHDRPGKIFGRLQVLILLSLLFMATDKTNALNAFRIGTGGSTGVYYPIGKLIAGGITEAGAQPDSPLSGLVGVAQNSAGSIENVRAVVTGEVEAGLVQADIAAYAVKKERQFINIAHSEKLRAIACLYPEKFQMVVRSDSGIRSFDDLRGKRISVDEPGSGTREATAIVLAAFGLTEKDLRPQFLKPAYTEDRMINGELDGFSMMAGAPMSAVTKLLPNGIKLLSIPPEIAAAIHTTYPHLTPGIIGAGTYPGIGETPTIEVYALFVVSSDMADKTAYALAQAIFQPSTQKLLQQGHPQGRNISLSSARKGLSIPLHPGAEKYYQEYAETRQ